MSTQTTDDDEVHFLEHEQIPVRSLQATDREAIGRIDRHVTGHARQGYLTKRLDEAVSGSDIRIGLVAEVDDQVVGFLIGSVYYGEFGVPEPSAVIDTIGVDPGYGKKGVGRALVLKLLANLHALGIERVQTEVDWKQLDLIGFLARMGFGPAPRICLERKINSEPPS